MKQRILTSVFFIAIAFSGIVGYATVIKADLNDRYAYSFYNMDTLGYTNTDEKATDRAVFIHPTSGPGLKYTVQGRKDGTSWKKRSEQKTIYSGSKVRLANEVHDHDETWVRVKFVRTTTGYTYTHGYWNPDPL